MKKEAQKYVNPERQSLADNKEKLRQAKKIWNKSLQQDFVSELIKFKQLLNGRREGGDKIKLYESMPDEMVSTISELGSVFNAKMEQAKSIIDFQNNYSSQYNKFYGDLEAKRKSNIAKKSSYEFEFNKVAANPYSKFLFNVKSIFNKDNSFKNDLLNSLYDIDRSYSQLELDILNMSDLDAVTAARVNRSVSFVNNKFYYITEKIGYFFQKVRDQTPAIDEAPAYSDLPGGTSPTLSGVTDEMIDFIHADFNKFYYQLAYSYKEKFDKLEKSSIDKLRRQLTSYYDKKTKGNLTDTFKQQYPAIRQLYSNILYRICNDLSLPSFDSFEKMYNYMKDSNRFTAEAYNIEDSLVALAVYDPMFRKIRTKLRKGLLSTKVFSKVKGDIEYIYSMIRQNRDLIDEIMNEITSNGELAQIYEQIKIASKSHQYIKNSIDNLSRFVGEESAIYKEKNKERDKETSLGLGDKDKRKGFFSSLFSGKKKNKT